MFSVRYELKHFVQLIYSLTVVNKSVLSQISLFVVCRIIVVYMLRTIWPKTVMYVMFIGPCIFVITEE